MRVNSSRRYSCTQSRRLTLPLVVSGNRTGWHQNEIRHTQTVRSRYRRGDLTPDGAQPLRRSLFGFVPRS